MYGIDGGSNWAGHVVRKREMINAYKIVVGKTERKR
jgi:hypothetical protein